MAGAAMASPSVAKLSSGQHGEIATILPGGQKVSGVRVAAGAVEVGVVARWVPSLQALADQIHAALGTVVTDRTVVLHIDDIVPPHDTNDQTSGSAAVAPL
ncbi:MAG TPA: hypothetical protein VLL25_08410 [Acidimicrobiales bacterium]|nr:hypothetical protein [Acidimicrobiales bacterium]